MEKIVERIKSFRELGQNWNGYGAEPLKPSVIAIALHFVDLIGCSPNIEVFPTARGTIQFEWENDLYYVETEVYPDGSVKSFSQWKEKFRHENCM